MAEPRQASWIPALRAAVVCAVFSSPALAQAETEAEEFLESRPFSIPDKQSARALFDQARAHVDGGRTTAAVTALQSLIVDHAGSVLALDPEAGNSLTSGRVFRGAASSARELFAKLPQSALEAYSERFSASGREALDRARIARDGHAMAMLAHRLPWTDVARDAWWSLGDLEAEAGHFAAAHAAWARAALRLDGAAPDADARSLAARRAWTPGDEALRAVAESYLGAPRADGDRIEIPAGTALGWETVHSFPTDRGAPLADRQGDPFVTFPVVSGDTVLVSDSLSLRAVDALTGALRWQSPEPAGWDQVRAEGAQARDGSRLGFADFFRGVDRDHLMLAPAAGAGIAVAALQVPVTHIGNTTFQGSIQITVVIPDRRLFAYDLASGKPLWNHQPPPLWDGDSGEFQHRMRIAGPPVIWGSRVFVPVWRPQGRISYHVACFDLATGAYLWSTQVASGQRPLNMFGRLEEEFCAPPLVIHGEKVIALTQLGTIAALDVFSGEILWQTVYDQIALPGADGMQAGNRAALWRNAPPLVEDSVVIAAPVDSAAMLGLDLETGSQLWQLDAERIGERPRYWASWTLLGARDHTIYLGGRAILALRAERGLRDPSGPTNYVRSEGLVGEGYGNASRLPRAILAGDYLIVPTREERIVLDRRALDAPDKLRTGGWGAAERAGMGNLAIADGALYTLSLRGLNGALDWRAIEAKLSAEFARAPDNRELATRLGRLLKERAANEFSAARHAAALEHIARATQVLEPHALAGAPEARAALFDALCLEAEVLIDDVRGSRSIERLERALEFAPDRPREALVLARIVEIAERSAPQRFESAIADLERRCADVEFPVDSDRPLDEASVVGRWVLEKRLAHATDRNDFAGAFAALFDLLERYGDGPLSLGTAARDGETPGDRIASLLSNGGRAAFAPFEARARAQLDVAQAGGDAAALESVSRRFPHTEAARDARNARLELALARGETAISVRTAFEELPADWTPRRSTPRQAQLAWRVARALAADGNQAYADGLLARLARELPDVPADVADPSVGFAALALRTATPPAPEGAAAVRGAESTFDLPASEIEGADEDWALLGTLDVAGERLRIVASRNRFQALAADGSRRWSRRVEGVIAAAGWNHAALLVPPISGASGGRVVLATRAGVVALDAADGSEAWSASVRGTLLDRPLAADNGVLMLAVTPPNQGQRLIGIDLARGCELWQHACPAELYAQPVVGGGLAVLLPRLSDSRRARVIEVATGTLAREIDVQQPVLIETRRAAWIDDGILVLPQFARTRAGGDWVVGIDLNEGTRAWRVAADGERALDSIVRCQGSTYLIQLSPGEDAKPGAVVELDTRLGAVREIGGLALGPEDMPIGLRPDAVTEIDAPYLFLRSPAPGGRETLVRAVHLPYGQRWAWRLPVPTEDLISQMLPLPAVTQSLVALAYTEEVRARGRRQSKTHLILIERDSGTLREARMLPEDLGRAEALELATLGKLLILRGQDRTMILSADERER